MGDKPSKHIVGRIERAMNLLAFLLDRREPVPWFVIRENVEGYHSSERRRPAGTRVAESSAPYTLQKTDSAAEKRFARDRRFLKAAGIDVKYHHHATDAPGGYYISRDDCFLPRLGLVAEENAFLWRLHDTASHSGFAWLSGPLLSAVQKLLFEESGEEPPQSGTDGVAYYLENKPDATVEQNLAILSGAIAERQLVSFYYHSIGRAAVQERLVAPYALGAYSGRWYLVGKCMVKIAARMFRLDRILTRVVIPDAGSEVPQFSIPENFSIRDHIGSRAWAMNRAERGEVCRARVRFDGEVGPYAAELLGDAAQCDLKPDGECVATLPVSREEPLIRWLMKFGRHAAVLGPPSLVNKFLETVRAVKDSYADGEADE